MSLKSSLIDIPLVEVLLIPTIFVLILALLALLDSQPSCDASCPCIGQSP